MSVGKTKNYCIDCKKLLNSTNSKRCRACAVTGKNNPFYGKHHSEETKKKIVMNRPSSNGSSNPNWRGGAVTYTCCSCNKTFEVSRDRICGQSWRFCNWDCYLNNMSSVPTEQTALNKKIGSIITNAIKNSTEIPPGYTKILGYTRGNLIDRLQGLFQTGMSLENYVDVWEIDHILPVSLFRFNKVKSKYFRMCWGLRNLSPIFKGDNRKKSGRISFLNKYTIISIDNGVSGSIGFVKSDNSVSVYHTPTFSDTKYTKEEAYITRVEVNKLSNIITNEILNRSPYHVVAILERPMINPGRFAASMSAIRALEATLIVLETLGIPCLYMDSKEWQHALLNTHGEELKKESLEKVKSLFPDIDFNGFDDGDGLLMGVYFKQKLEYLNSLVEKNIQIEGKEKCIKVRKKQKDV